MGRLHDLWYRLRALLSGKRMDREFTDEVAFHLDMETQDLIRSGMKPAEARRRAELAFGGVERYREKARDARGIQPLEDLIQDVRFALRSFWRHPTFTLAAILILGTGIGATTMIYSVVDTVLLRPLPYPSPGQLVQFGAGIRPLRYTEWQNNLESFEAIGAAWNMQVPLTGDGVPEEVQASAVTLDLLPLFEATPHLGRLFMRDDYEGEGTVAVLGHGLWQRRWGGDPDVIGHQIRVDGQPVVIAGVISPEFEPPISITGDHVDVWLPLNEEDEESWRWSILVVAGRLRDRVGLEAAQDELDVLHTRLAEQYPEIMVQSDGSINHLRLTPLRDATVGKVTDALMLLMGAVWLMLLIACANVANLLLARGTVRAKEIAIRNALGAGRRRILSQHLTESVTLAVAGGALGIGLTHLGVSTLPHFLAGTIPRIEDLSVDLRILFFALMASLGTGFFFGILPALSAVRKDVRNALEKGSKRATPARRGGRIRNSLVVAEIAVALVLLSGAGLFFRSFINLASLDPGFDAEQLVTVRLSLRGDYTAPEREQFTRDVVDRIKAISGTEAVAVGLTVPFQYLGASKCCLWSRVGRESARNTDERLSIVPIHPITPEYFQALGANVSYGREFSPEDNTGDNNIAVINEPLAQDLFGSGSAVGRPIYLKGWDAVVDVVGVVPAIHHWGPTQGAEPAAYLPYAPWGADNSHFHILVRSAAEFETMVPALKEAIWAVAPDLPVEEIISMRQRVEASTAGPRFFSILLATFASISLVLATGGVYASMLFAVNRRRKEMGIRLALGARGTQLTSSVLRQGLSLSVLGVGFGILASMAVTRVFRSGLWGISPTDAGTFISVTLVLITATLLACLIPAWAASRADPLDTLRAE